MYESPIDKYFRDIKSQIIKQDEEHLMYSVNQAVGYNVNKDELLKALQYDRHQYEKGYDDALDKVREDIVDTLYVDSLIFGELIDFRNGKISADDVIEEFNRVTRLEVLKILDKYRAEKEVEE